MKWWISKLNHITGSVGKLSLEQFKAETGVEVKQELIEPWSAVNPLIPASSACWPESIQID